MSESKSQQPLHYGQPVSEGEFTPQFVVSCPRCNDTGYVMDSDHDDECDGYTCSPDCPVPVQSPCPSCGFSDDDACSFRCDRGWLPAPTETAMLITTSLSHFVPWESIACPCNVDVRGLVV